MVAHVNIEHVFISARSVPDAVLLEEDRHLRNIAVPVTETGSERKALAARSARRAL